MGLLAKSRAQLPHWARVPGTPAPPARFATPCARASPPPLHPLPAAPRPDPAIALPALPIASVPQVRQERAPFLIAAPASVLPNWAAELQRWAPGLGVVEYRGAPEAREALWMEQARPLDPEACVAPMAAHPRGCARSVDLTDATPLCRVLKNRARARTCRRSPAAARPPRPPPTPRPAVRPRPRPAGGRCTWCSPASSTSWAGWTARGSAGSSTGGSSLGGQPAAD
jgi:hypothetical protein